MSSTQRLHSVYNVMHRQEYPDFVTILEDTDAIMLPQPFTVAYPIGLSLFEIDAEQVKVFDAASEEPNYIVQIVPIFAYKFEFNVLGADEQAVEYWYDGIPRLRGGTVSLVGNSTFIGHFTIHHEQQIERNVWALESIVGTGKARTFLSNYGGEQIENEHHFADYCPTHIAHRLTKTLELECKVWWLYRITMFELTVV